MPDDRPDRSRPRTRRSRRLLWVVLPIVLAYALAETWITTRAALDSAPDFWVVCEGEGDLIRFDPVTGLRISSEPWRMAQVHHGELEFVSTVRGNALGFPDRHDFGPRRRDPAVPRVAVLGDSFTAGLHLDVNWPDRVEERLSDGLPESGGRPVGRRVELLNLSLSGIGLQNWWSTVEGLLDAEDWQLDAVVFAVWGNDLIRQFHVGDAGDGERLLRGRVGSWDTADYPRDLREAEPWLRRSRMYRVGPHDFDRAVAGDWTPPLDWRPRLAGAWAERLGAVLGVPPADAEVLTAGAGLGASPFATLDRAPSGLRGLDVRAATIRSQVDDIARWIRARGLRCLVVLIPPRPFLVPGEPPHPRPLDEYVRATAGFASSLGARFVDGGLAFEAVPPERRSECFPPHDLHWNQRGSDVFAEFMVPRIETLVEGLPRRPPPGVLGAHPPVSGR